ncbi:MAG: sodium/proton-translocating pyrophosphatase [Candidatus Margulisbacteria bacterium]|nr:sodium/proton-translocating pyrophosphatase [Candidatus Margulisiibacteriota bacterium]
MNLERLQNIINLIRENLVYLLKKTSLAVLFLLLIFTFIIFIIFYFNGSFFKVEWIISFLFGSLVALLSLNFSLPFGFMFLKKREVRSIEKPDKLFDLYFGTGLFTALLMIIIPLLGLFVSLYILGINSVIYYLLGLSIVSFFIRIGGGIFAKAADISSNFMVNESKEKINCNDYRNVSSIADKIGDFLNNGLALNMDLVESFVGIIVAVIFYVNLYVLDKSITFTTFVNIVSYPLIIIVASILLSFIAGFVLLFLKRKTVLGSTLKPLHGIYLSLVLITIFSFIFSNYHQVLFFQFISFLGTSPNYSPFICIFMGLALAVVIGLATDYYTSDAHKPVKEIVKFSEYSHVTNELNGLAVGMKSLYIPIILEALFILVSYKLSGYYGIILLATGLLSMAPIIIASSIYAPFADNVNGIIKMETGDTYAQNAVFEQFNSIGNTLSALAKNFAANAVLIVVFSLFISFVKLSGLKYQAIPIFHPVILAALFIGGLLPFILSSTLIRALSFSTIQMFEESKLQLNSIPYLKEKQAFPDVRRFIKTSGIKIIKDLIAPSVLVFLLPVIIGKFFGIEILSAVFIGIMLSGIFLSISYANTGAVLDNSKKMIEKGYFGGTGTPTYSNAISGDLFGDALKDLIGPSLNNFIKVVIIISIIIIPIII